MGGGGGGGGGVGIDGFSTWHADLKGVALKRDVHLFSG